MICTVNLLNRDGKVLNVRDISEVLSELEEQEEPKEESSNDLNKLAHSLIITVMLMLNHRSDSPNDLSAQLQRLTQANLEPRGEVKYFDLHNIHRYSNFQNWRRTHSTFGPRRLRSKSPRETRDQREVRDQREIRDQREMSTSSGSQKEI